MRRVLNVDGTAVDDSPQISDLAECARGLDGPSVALLDASGIVFEGTVDGLRTSGPLTGEHLAAYVGA